MPINYSCGQLGPCALVNDAIFGEQLSARPLMLSLWTRAEYKNPGLVKDAISTSNLPMFALVFGHRKQIAYTAMCVVGPSSQGSGMCVVGRSSQ